MSAELLLILAIATIAASLYLILSEEIQRFLAATVFIICLLICLFIAPLPVQGLIFVGVLFSTRHLTAIE